MSSFNRDKKISSDVIALIFSEAGPNRIIIHPFAFQPVDTGCSHAIQFGIWSIKMRSFSTCKYHAKSTTYDNFSGTVKILSGYIIQT